MRYCVIRVSLLADVCMPRPAQRADRELAAPPRRATIAMGTDAELPSSCSGWASWAAASSISRPTSTSCFCIPRARRDRRGACSRHEELQRSARPEAHRAAAGHGDARRFRLPGGSAPAAVRRIGPARGQLWSVRGLSAAAWTRLGALRLRQGAADRGRDALRGAVPQRAAPLRLPSLSRLRRVRLAARDEGADRARSRAARAQGQHQAGPGRHTGDRVHRAGIPADPRWQRSSAADPQSAHRAVAACRSEAAAHRGGRRAGCGVSLPAPRRESPAAVERRTDARAAGGRGGTGAAGARDGCRGWAEFARTWQPTAIASAPTFRTLVFVIGAPEPATGALGLERMLEPKPTTCVEIGPLRDTGMLAVEPLSLRASRSCATAHISGGWTRRADAGSRHCCRSCCNGSRGAIRSQPRSTACCTFWSASAVGPCTSHCSTRTRVALSRLVDLCAQSEFLAEQIAAHPLLLDELLDERLIETIPIARGVRGGAAQPDGWRRSRRP